MTGGCRQCGASGVPGDRFCGSCGTALLAPPVGVRKTVTVLFTDVHGRSGLAERLDTEVVRRMASELYATIRAVLEEHGATVEKYAGDAVMAVFGVPVAHEDDAQRAASAALALVGRIGPLVERIEAASGVRLGLQTALNTGEVLSGNDGDQGLVLGEAVVVAARLLQHAAPGEVLLGPDTARLLTAVVRTGEPRELLLRGRAQSLRAHPLIEVRQTVARTRRTPMLGRTTERALLAAALERAVRGRSAHLVTVLGEAGLGKSRLIDDFLDAQSSAGVLVRRVRCRSYGARVQWSPLPDLLDDLPTDSLPTDAQQVLAALRGQGAGPSAAEVAWALGLETRWLATHGPCIVVLEDLHGAEPEVLEVVQDVVRRLDDVPLLVLVTARPTLHDACPGWTSGLRQVMSLSLPPMSVSDARRHAELLLAPAVAPDALLDQVVEAAGGNPLWLEQVVSVLVETGRVVRDGSTWQVVGDPTDLDLPPTVAALLAARLDRLPPAERHVLERGALLGKQFVVDDVRDLADDGLRNEVEGLLDALMRRDLLRGHGVLRAFPSSLVREAAYGGLARAERARLHEQVGRRLAAHPGWEELAGGHLEQAVRHRTEIGVAAGGLRDTAADLLTGAGLRALTGDARVATALLARATDLLDADDPRRLLVVPDLARVRALTGDLSGAEALLRDAQARAVAAGHEQAVAHSRLGLMELLRLTDPDAAADQIPGLVADIVPLLHREADDRGLSLAHMLQASAHQYRVRWGAMEDPLERALLHAHRAGDARLTELAQSLLVGSVFHGPTHLVEVERRLLAMAGAPGISRSHRASISARLAGTRGLQGDFEAAVVGLDEARDIFVELGRPLSAAATAFIRGPVLMLANQPAAAAETLDQSCEVLRGMGDRAYVSTLLALLAEARWRCGDGPGAQSAVDGCRRTGADSDVITQLRWRAVQAKLCAASGDGAQALVLADQAVALAAHTDELTSQADVLVDRAEMRELLGDSVGAQVDLRDAVARYERKGATQAIRRLADLLFVADLPLPDLATLVVPDQLPPELTAKVNAP